MSKMDRGLMPRSEPVQTRVTNIHRTEAERNTRFENRKSSSNNDVTIGARRIAAGHKTSIHLGNDKAINASSKQIHTLDWQKEYQAPLTARGELESRKREGQDVALPVRAGGFKKDCSIPEFGAGTASFNANLQNHIKDTSPRIPRGILGTKSSVELGSMRQSYDDFRKEKKSYEGQIERKKTPSASQQGGAILRVKDSNSIRGNQVAGTEKTRHPGNRFEAPYSGQENILGAVTPRRGENLGNVPSAGRIKKMSSLELGPKNPGPRDFKPTSGQERVDASGHQIYAGAKTRQNWIDRELPKQDAHTPRNRPPPGGYSSIAF